MNSFLGGAYSYGAGMPDYADIGSMYAGDYFNTSVGSSAEDIGQAILSGLSAFRSSQEAVPVHSSRPRTYEDETKSTMNNMLAQAVRAFGNPRALI